MYFCKEYIGGEVEALAYISPYNTQADKTCSSPSTVFECMVESSVCDSKHFGFREWKADMLEYVFNIGFQLVDAGSFIGMCPRTLYRLSCKPQTETGMLWIGTNGVIVCRNTFIVTITITEFIETEVGALPIYIAPDGLKTSEEKCLTHHIEVGTKRIHNMYETSRRARLSHIIVVLGRCERVVQYFVESTADKLFADEVL